MLRNNSQAHPYAKAIFATATTKQTIPAWTALLQRASVIANDPQVQLLFNNPQVTSEQLADFFIELCGEAIAVLKEQGGDFIKLLAEYRRLSLIADIANAFEYLVAEHENILYAQITSANPLNEKNQQDLVQALKKRFGRGIRLTCNTDKNLIGGLVIRVGDLVIDSSIRDKLIRLKESLIAQQDF